MMPLTVFKLSHISGNVYYGIELLRLMTTVIICSFLIDIRANWTLVKIIVVFVDSVLKLR